jgi:2-haloacid dehalogenase
VRIYKPRPEVYALVTDALAVKPHDVACVSSNRWDVMGAASFGFAAVWLNRTQLPDEYAEPAPLREIPDLAALAD